ncbi:UrcA family protein [Kineobactrum salinum]|uniref:UrcA family protein n=1 Tax=Kineobactrum salinum TaxID=2708301 RepID=A0A6C0U270_9GAMM|nr:UrcA family protein [Kineobactrum salinum]QIB66252.1 UrcA family protein [Kineobactrum salinum]
MNSSKISTRIGALVFGISTLLTTSAMAEAYTETLVQSQAVAVRSVAVSVADLDLASSEGQDTMYYRLSQAAREVCGPSGYRQAGGARQAARNQACYHQALSDALAQASAGRMASLDD